ncbi:TF29 protein, partial [Rhynochetos jubatus]|nr:TF29 protein [Rhynochetos jubatus]
ATIDVKDMFFTVPLQEKDRDCFSFAWEGQQHTFTCLPQDYKHSPTLAHHALALELAQILPEPGVRVYQYIGDVLIGGDQIIPVQVTQEKIIQHLRVSGTPDTRGKDAANEVKFLGIWWKGGSVCIPQDTLSALDQVKIPENKKELQHALGLLVFWRKHIPDFAIIVRPLYNLLQKRTTWEWAPAHDEALQFLVFEASTHQASGPVHSTFR